MKVLSVSSSVRTLGSRPDESSASVTILRSVPDWTWRGETLTAISHGSSGRSRFQALTWRHASPATHSPIGTMSPVSSAIGMKSSGRTRPRVGSIQRISASVPMKRPRCKSMMGW